MKRIRHRATALVAVVLSGALAIPQAAAGPFDGLAGAAVGFALGAMIAGHRGGGYAPRYRRVAAYPVRPVVRRQIVRSQVAAAPARRVVPTGGGAAINAASDPFAGSAGAKVVPVAGQ